MTEDSASFTEFATLLTVLANEKRLHILTLLLQSEVSVGDLAEAVGLSQSSLSQHLAKLRELGLVSTRRNAQTVYYRSHDRRVTTILHTLAALAAVEKLCPKKVGHWESSS